MTRPAFCSSARSGGSTAGRSWNAYCCVQKLAAPASPPSGVVVGMLSLKRPATRWSFHRCERRVSSFCSGKNDESLSVAIVHLPSASDYTSTTHSKSCGSTSDTNHGIVLGLRCQFIMLVKQLTGRQPG